MAPKIRQTIAAEPTTSNTKVEMSAPGCWWLSWGVGSPRGTNKATCAILDTFDVRLLLSTLWMAMNKWVEFSSERVPILNVKVCLELASFGNRSVVLTWRASSK